jgi:hypothetical protein
VSYSRGKTSERRLPIADARANKLKTDWKNYTPPVPRFLGVKAYDKIDLRAVSKYIDWTPFFRTWELVGTYPMIFEDDKVGASAKALYADAQKMLKRMVEGQWLTARAAVGFWPANAVASDDIEIYSDAERTQVLGTFHTLRQQMRRVMADQVEGVGALAGDDLDTDIRRNGPVEVFQLSVNLHGQSRLCQARTDGSCDVSTGAAAHRRADRTIWQGDPDFVGSAGRHGGTPHGSGESKVGETLFRPCPEVKVVCTYSSAA